MDRQRNRCTDIRINGQTDGQTNRMRDKWTDRQTNEQTGRQWTDIHMDRDTERGINGQTEG